MTPTSQHTPVAMLNVVGLVVAAAGIMVQYAALPAGIIATRRSSHRAGVAGRPRGAQ